MGDVDGTSIVLGRDMANVGVARAFVRAQLGHAIGGEALSDLVLATSELVTNAFEHGSGESAVVAVRLSTDAAAVTVTSHADRSEVAPAERWTTAEPEQLSGRGLGIVRTLADRIEVRRDDDALAITVVRQLVPLA